MSDSFTVATVEAGKRLHLQGALIFATVASGYAEGLARMSGVSSGSVLEIDCAGLTQIDSGGLAVLLDWLREAALGGRVLRFVNLPDSLLHLAQISEVDALLQPS